MLPPDSLRPVRDTEDQLPWRLSWGDGDVLYLDRGTECEAQGGPNPPPTPRHDFYEGDLPRSAQPGPLPQAFVQLAQHSSASPHSPRAPWPGQAEPHLLVPVGAGEEGTDPDIGTQKGELV